ncbi:MAG: hypothetical protein ABSC06_30630 [Rhodopila sp.]|jgi:hypothetical protein
MARENDDPEPVAEPVAEPVPDAPGKAPELAASSGAEPEPTPGLSPLGMGAQVVLTGDAQAAARGGTHGDIAANTAARDAAIAAGHIEPATADAAAHATSGAIADELDEAEAEAIAKVRADFAAKRVERAAKPAS